MKTSPTTIELILTTLNIFVFGIVFTYLLVTDTPYSTTFVVMMTFFIIGSINYINGSINATNNKHNGSE